LRIVVSVFLGKSAPDAIEMAQKAELDWDLLQRPWARQQSPPPGSL